MIVDIICLVKLLSVCVLFVLEHNTQLSFQAFKSNTCVAAIVNSNHKDIIIGWVHQHPNESVAWSTEAHGAATRISPIIGGYFVRQTQCSAFQVTIQGDQSECIVQR